MKSLLTFTLTVAFFFLAGLCWMLNEALEHERTKPLLMQAGYNPKTGDVVVRLASRPEEWATFRGMCPRSQFN